jgi:hypothetical protein
LRPIPADFSQAIRLHPPYPVCSAVYSQRTENCWAYFAALDKIIPWGYDIGDLALAYVDEQGEPSRLLFAATE